MGCLFLHQLKIKTVFHRHAHGPAYLGKSSLILLSQAVLGCVKLTVTISQCSSVNQMWNCWIVWKFCESLMSDSVRIDVLQCIKVQPTNNEKKVQFLQDTPALIFFPFCLTDSVMSSLSRLDTSQGHLGRGSFNGENAIISICG